MDGISLSPVNGSGIAGASQANAPKRPSIMQLLENQAQLVEMVDKLSREVDDKTIVVRSDTPEGGEKTAKEDSTQAVRPDNVIRIVNHRLETIVDRLAKISRTLNI